MAMNKLPRRTVFSVKRGFLHGLAQMSGFGHTRVARPKVISRSAAQSLGSDWDRLGDDINQAVKTVRERDLEKAPRCTS